MLSVVHDLRHALLTLTQRPGFSGVVVLTFAIAAGAVTAAFTFVRGIVLQPLPYPSAERIVVVKHTAPGLGLVETGVSDGTYFHYRDRASSFEAIAVYSEQVLNLSTRDAGTFRVQVTHAGPELFELLGIEPLLGRLFTAEDAAPGFLDTRWPIPVLLSHELWQRAYGGDPGIVGNTITLNNRERRVQGVLPADFRFPHDYETEIWMLFIPTEAAARFASRFDYSAIARLRPGISPESAEAELRHILPSIEGAYRDATAQRVLEVKLEPIVVPLKDEVIRSVRVPLLLVFGGMTLLLLVACANIATLSLLREERRQQEVAVRRALGAGRGDLLRLFVSEATVLYVLGGVLSLLFAYVAVRTILFLTPIPLPRTDDIGLDVSTILFTFGLALIAAALIGGLSYAKHLQARPLAALKTLDDVSTRRGHLRLRGPLVAIQVALTLTLLISSALMVQTFGGLMRVDPGFQPADVLAIEIGLPGVRAREHQRVYERLLLRLRTLPGVQQVSAASSLPFDAIPDAFPMQAGVLPTRTEQPVALKFIMPGYFQAMKIPIVEGATFAVNKPEDIANSVVVSAALARRLFPGRSAVGEMIRRLNSDGTPVAMFDRVSKTSQAVPPWRIAGVAGNVREVSLRSGVTDIVYVPILDPPVERSIVPINMNVLIRSESPVSTLTATAREVIRDVDPMLAVGKIRSLDAIVAASIARERFLAILLMTAAAASLFLGVVGVYGIAAQAVRRAEREIGIRISLGARPGQILAMVLTRSGVFVLSGIVVGLATTFVATRALGSFLFDITATDSLTVAVGVSLLISVALIATLVPARRAMRLDPVAAIRGE